MGKSALLIHHRWCVKTLQQGKVWEIRNKARSKRGRIVLASTAKTSPTGSTVALGEVTVKDCIVVARQSNGLLLPPDEAPNSFLFLKENMAKHQIGSFTDFPGLKSYQTVYAWVFSEPEEYSKPRPIKAKTGCVTWANIWPAETLCAKL